VDIDAEFADGRLTFVLSDSGKPFDPTQASEPDLTLQAEDRPIGGLGIFLVRQIMDSVEYRYSDGKNILTLTKNIQSNN
jgi:anti-sigma regulatory factor (Ser/Thr protein kinase)